MRAQPKYILFSLEPVKSKKKLYIILLNVVCAIHLITVAKSKMYSMGVKSMASGLTFFSPKQYFLLLDNNFCFTTVINCIAYTIFNLNKKVRVHWLVLLVQLNWRVASPLYVRAVLKVQTVEQISTFKLIFNTLLPFAHPWYFGCSQD